MTAYLQQVGCLAAASLHRWPIPGGASLRLLNVSENVTYLVEAPDGFRAVLRVHRQGYHTRRAIECELAWMAALREDGVIETARVHIGRDRQAIQAVTGADLPGIRHMVLFHFIEGSAPNEAADLAPLYRQIGAFAARCHDHARDWHRPPDFERLAWDDAAVFGATPTWGNWRDAPGVTAGIRAVLEEAEAMVKARLAAYGKGADRYGLIHADMRLANLLVTDHETRLIDFDDCGFGWFPYDFAAAVSFIEDDPRIPQFKAAWLAGYRMVRPLSAVDEAEIDTFVMLRRMALLAWIGSHIEAPEPQALAPDFAEDTASLATAWLARC